MLKQLLVIATLVTLSHSLFAGELECVLITKGLKGNSYPLNKLAIEQTANENVKTCKSEKFQFAMKKLGHTVKVRQATPAEKLVIMENQYKADHNAI
jgi:hypothetical protein